MPRKTKATVEVEVPAGEAQEPEVEEAAEPKKVKKTYTVHDSNGKAVRTTDDEEHAAYLAKVYGGKVK